MTYTYNNKGTCSVRTVVELNETIPSRACRSWAAATAT